MVKRGTGGMDNHGFLSLISEVWSGIKKREVDKNRSDELRMIAYIL